MKLLHIIGADLSKKSIDFANPEGVHFKVSNDLSGYHQLMGWLKKQKINIPQIMMVMEHTGLYSYQLEQFLQRNQIHFTKVSALAIKRSMGLVRGKSDKIDAIRIAQYGYEKRNSLVAIQPVSKSLERLQWLHSTRERFVKNRAALKNGMHEYQHNCSLKQSDLLIQSQSQLIQSFDRQIQKLDNEIALIVEGDKNLKHNYELLQSVIGVGKVVALATVIKTRNFTRFNVARKFACFSGTAPFEYTSGTSIRGKTRISHLADKEMKTLLDLAAKSAIQYDKELREYYLRRIQAGKSKKSTRNIVRNKIIYRMFAVIKRQTPFIKNYLESA